MKDTEHATGISVRVWAVLAALVVLIASCAKASTPEGSPTPSPSATVLSIPALKLAVLAAVGGRLSYCDPDQYPVARSSELDAARARFPTIEQDRVTFDAILAYEHLSSTQTTFTDAQLVAINDDYKQMQAIQLQPVGAAFRFDVQATQKDSPTGIEHELGTVSRTGMVTIQQREPGHRFPCPICLAAGVLIATPAGQVPVQDVQIGMPVWTTDRQGRRIAGVVLAVGRMEAPLGHEVVRIELADGRTVTASPGHPTADGGSIGSLRPGDRMDGSKVVRVELVPYDGFTFDLLPSGPTGTYFANDVLLGSTLAGRTFQGEGVSSIGSGASSSGSSP